jgi:lysophospholipid acyltransferase (LPLAT)-like uncharacterized protein
VPATAKPEPSSEPKPRKFTLRQRILISLVSSVTAALTFLIGITMRWTVELEDGSALDLSVPNIYVFWHECIFALAWRYSHRSMAVITSRSYDGEFIARTIEKLGYTAVRGSSSKGGVGALLGMHDVIAHGKIAIFTIDGPRGPRHVAKPGPILLAKNTQVPVYCAHAAAASKWRLKSWDKMMIPKPFTRAFLRISHPIHVPPNADDATLQRLHIEMQAGLERVMEYAEARVRPAAQRVKAAAD